MVIFAALGDLASFKLVRVYLAYMLRIREWCRKKSKYSPVI